MEAVNNSVLAQKYQAQSVREKVLLIGAAVVVIYLLFNVLLFTPYDQQQQELDKVLSQEQQQLSGLSQQLATLSQALLTDPDQAKKKQLQALQAQRQTLDGALEQMSAGLIPAEELPRLLQDVLVNLDGVELLAMHTLPVEELLFSDPGEQTETSNQFAAGELEEPQDRTVEDAVGVFKHGVAITLAGDYFAVVDYLTALEALDWRFYWDLVHYQVDGYPQAKVELQVYTLSTEIGSLGN